MYAVFQSLRERGGLFTLLAFADRPHWQGEIARRSFATQDEAEIEMTKWARFGIDATCNEADELVVLDADAQPVLRWNWGGRCADVLKCRS